MTEPHFVGRRRVRETSLTTARGKLQTPAEGDIILPITIISQMLKGRLTDVACFPKVTQLIISWMGI